MTTLKEVRKALNSISSGAKIKKGKNDDYVIYGGIRLVSFKSLQSFNTVFDVKAVEWSGKHDGVCIIVDYPKTCNRLG